VSAPAPSASPAGLAPLPTPPATGLPAKPAASPERP
jgi:hypothetical protein